MILTRHQSYAGLGNSLTRGLSKPAWLCLVLGVVTFLVYWPVLSCGFLNYDDPDYFTTNTHVQTGLTPGNVVWAFGAGDTWNWHPLTWLSLMLDVTFFGKGPTGPHLTNLLFHLANTVLVFVLFWRLTSAYWRSALVAALFALHPLHVESVAWISERKDVLSAFFSLLALLFYASYGKKRPGIEHRKPDATAESLVLGARPPVLDYTLAWLFFVLALMSKPMAVTLPFVMLLLDVWPLGRISGNVKPFQLSTGVRLILEKIPFLVLSAMSCVVTFLVQQKGGAVAQLARIPMTARIENALVSYVRYLGKTIWPDPLANPYPYPGHWESGLVLFAALLLAGICVAAVWLGRKFPFVPAGWFWFFGTLIPVIGLVQVGTQSMADRYTYLPLIGLFVMLAWGLGEVCARWRSSQPFVVAVIMLFLVAGALRARDQIGYWQDSGTLFNHTLAVTKDNYVAYNNLGTYLCSQGRIEEGMRCYVRSLQISPNDSDVWYNLGNALTKLNDLDGAVHAYHRALQLAPDHADILNNLGFTLATEGRFTDAVECFEEALRLNPGFFDAHNNLADVLYYQHKYAEAIPHYRKAIRLVPNNPQLYSNLADALVKQGLTAEAVKCYQAALQLKPGDLQIQEKLRALEVPNSN